MPPSHKRRRLVKVGAEPEERWHCAHLIAPGHRLERALEQCGRFSGLQVERHSRRCARHKALTRIVKVEAGQERAWHALNELGLGRGRRRTRSGRGHCAHANCAGRIQEQLKQPPVVDVRHARQAVVQAVVKGVRAKRACAIRLWDGAWVGVCALACDAIRIEHFHPRRRLNGYLNHDVEIEHSG